MCMAPLAWAKLRGRLDGIRAVAEIGPARTLMSVQGRAILRCSDAVQSTPQLCPCQRSHAHKTYRAALIVSQPQNNRHIGQLVQPPRFSEYVPHWLAAPQNKYVPICANVMRQHQRDIANIGPHIVDGLAGSQKTPAARLAVPAHRCPASDFFQF